MSNFQVKHIFEDSGFLLSRVVIVVSLAVYLLYFDKILESRVSIVIRKNVSSLISPVFYTNEIIKSSARNINDYFQDQSQLVAELEDARAKILSLEQQSIVHTRKAEEIERLTNISRFAATSSWKLKAVVYPTSVVLPTNTQVMTITGNSNISTGDFVIDDFGLIGKVKDVGLATTEVELISSKDVLIPAFAGRYKDNFLVEGFGDFTKVRAKVKLSSILENIKVGDNVYTSGLGGSFTRGYLIGSVSDIKYEPTENVSYLEIELSSRLDSLSFLGIIGK